MSKKFNTLSEWTLLKEEELLKTPILTLNMDRYRSERNGVEGNFYTFDCCDWVNVIAITDSDQLVMIRQYRHGTRKVELEIPGGGIEEHENNPIAAGARELLEETGYQGENGIIIGKVCPNPALQGNDCFTILFKDVAKECEPDMESTEDIETILVPIEDLRNKITKGEITHGLVLNALYFLELWKEETM